MRILRHHFQPQNDCFAVFIRGRTHVVIRHPIKATTFNDTAHDLGIILDFGYVFRTMKENKRSQTTR